MKNLIKFLYFPVISCFFVLAFSNSILARTLDEIFILSYEAAITEPNVVSSKSMVNSMESNLSSAKRQRLPNFVASITNGITIDRNVNDRDALRKYEDEGLDLQLQMVQPLFTGFKIQSAIDKGKADLQSSILETNMRIGQTAIESAVAYISYVQESNLSEIIENTLERVSNLLELEKKRFDTGLVDLSYLASVRIQVSKIQLFASNQSNNFLNARAIFQRFFPTEELPNEKKLDIIKYNFPTYDIQNDSYELAQAKEALRASKADLSSAIGNRLPSVALTVTGKLYDIDGRKDKEEEEYDIKGGLQASWQFLDFGVNRKKVSSARSNVNARRYYIEHQRRLDEVEKLRLLASISRQYQQIKEQYTVLNDISNQERLLEAQLTSTKFLGGSLADILHQKIQIITAINQLEGNYVIDNLKLALLTQNLSTFIARIN
tara:strand:+ start:746 stop:2050 length:1305 start_codon:yes stop_codon:yes gene_type:complete